MYHSCLSLRLLKDLSVASVLVPRSRAARHVPERVFVWTQPAARLDGRSGARWLG